MIDLGDNVVACDPTSELMEICLSSFGMMLNWNATNSTNNALSYTCVRTGVVTPILLQPGNYTNKQLAKALSIDSSTIICTYLPQFNMLQWTFPEAYTISYSLPGVGVLMGLSTTSKTGTIVQSDVALNPTPVKNLCLHVEGVTPFQATNASVGPSRKMLRSSLLLAIPLNCPPYAEISYVNRNDDFALFVSESRLTKLNFRFTDFDGNALTNLPDHHLALRVNTYARDSTTLEKKLDELIKLTRLSLVS
jgi:hypothetical protein